MRLALGLWESVPATSSSYPTTALRVLAGARCVPRDAGRQRWQRPAPLASAPPGDELGEPGISCGSLTVSWCQQADQAGSQRPTSAPRRLRSRRHAIHQSRDLLDLIREIEGRRLVLDRLGLGPDGYDLPGFGSARGYSV